MSRYSYTLTSPDGPGAAGLSLLDALGCLWHTEDKGRLANLERGQTMQDADGDTWERTQ